VGVQREASNLTRGGGSRDVGDSIRPSQGCVVVDVGWHQLLLLVMVLLLQLSAEVAAVVVGEELECGS
jgi:hypothetical protein